MDSIGDMARATIRMVSAGIDAFVKKDLDLARKVIDMDDEVDDLFVRVKEELIELIRQNGPSVNRPSTLSWWPSTLNASATTRSHRRMGRFFHHRRAPLFRRGDGVTCPSSTM